MKHALHGISTQSEQTDNGLNASRYSVSKSLYNAMNGKHDTSLPVYGYREINSTFNSGNDETMFEDPSNFKLEPLFKQNETTFRNPPESKITKEKNPISEPHLLYNCIESPNILPQS